MSQLDNNNNINKENLTVVMDYSHENSMSINVQKNENIKNKKIIPISENDIKMKKIKFNDLPNLYNENKNMNKNNGNKRQELNNEESKNKNMNDYTQLEINYNKMNKELEELKNENSYIKLKLKEISNIQNFTIILDIFYDFNTKLYKYVLLYVIIFYVL